MLEALYIIVQIICPIDFPSLKMDESYKLDVTRKTAVLKANEVWFYFINKSFIKLMLIFFANAQPSSMDFKDWIHDLYYLDYL